MQRDSDKTTAIGHFVYGLVVSLLFVTSGCAGNVVAAKKLPPEFAAPPVANAQTVDLSRLASVSASSELIEPGDILKVTIGSGYSGDDTITVPVRVADDGTANIPWIQQVALAGLEVEGAQQVIAAEAISRGILKTPFVTVVMEKKRTNKVTVLGAVERPGVYEVPRGGSDILSAIVAAGGLTENAGTFVEVRRPAQRLHAHELGQPMGPREALRPGTYPASYNESPAGFRPPQSVRIDLVAAAHSGQGGVQVGDGDVVMVMKNDPKPIHVMGLVKKPNQYEMPPNQEVHVLDALAMAGGVDSIVADKIYVIRRVPGKSEPVVIKVSVYRAKLDGQENLRLAPGDIVSVEQTPATMMLDAVTSFVRIGVSGRIPLF